MKIEIDVKNAYEKLHGLPARNSGEGWDNVIITASDDRQAEIYRSQLQYRLENGLLSRRPRYLVLPDPDGKRVGSGGATLAAIRNIHQGGDYTAKTLLIHSGGDSRRVPQYSVCGKLFSPLPTSYGGGELFDELMLLATALAGRCGDGLLLLSGDVLLLGEHKNIDFIGADCGVVGIKMPLAEGSGHGVFTEGENGRVGRFLHKKSPQTLLREGAADADGNVNIDSGIAFLGPEVLKRLNALALPQFISDKVRLNFYGDILCPLIGGITLEQFLAEKGELADSKELENCRVRLFEALSGFKCRLGMLDPGVFLHFGTTAQLLRLMCGEGYGFADSTRISGGGRAIDSNIFGSVGKGCYVEYSRLGGGVRLGDGCVVSCVEAQSGALPADTAVSGVKLADGGFAVRIYDVSADPKVLADSEPIFLGRPFSYYRELIGDEKLWADGEEKNLWNARLFEVCDTSQQAFDAAIRLADGKADLSKDRVSLASGFARADARFMLDMRQALSAAVITQKRFDAVREEILSQYRAPRLPRKLPDTDICEIFLPLRVNFGGGWTDTPPYCTENGGAVLNAAITLNGRLPAHAVIRRAHDGKITLRCLDSGESESFYDSQSLRGGRDPLDPFAIHRAVLSVCGITEADFSDLMRRGGFELATEAVGVPRGSGLGTSSILAAAAAEAVNRFFGLGLDNSQIAEAVLAAEQLMGTGGGWQDQLGGLCPGFKYITSTPSARQLPVADPLRLSGKTLGELQDRFALIYTGKRRLARNLLRSVMGGYMDKNPVSVGALTRIKRLSLEMKVALESGDINGFAALLTLHLEQSRLLDPGCADGLLDTIFGACEPYTDGRMVCGAGGGGFLQVILREGVQKSQLAKALERRFPDSEIRLCESDFYMG